MDDDGHSACLSNISFSSNCRLGGYLAVCSCIYSTLGYLLRSIGTSTGVHRQGFASRGNPRTDGRNSTHLSYIIGTYVLQSTYVPAMD